MKKKTKTPKTKTSNKNKSLKTTKKKGLDVKKTKSKKELLIDKYLLEFINKFAETAARDNQFELGKINENEFCEKIIHEALNKSDYCLNLATNLYLDNSKTKKSIFSGLNKEIDLYCKNKRLKAYSDFNDEHISKTELFYCLTLILACQCINTNEIDFKITKEGLEKELIKSLKDSKIYEIANLNKYVIINN